MFGEGLAKVFEQTWMTWGRKTYTYLRKGYPGPWGRSTYKEFKNQEKQNETVFAEAECTRIRDIGNYITRQAKSQIAKDLVGHGKVFIVLCFYWTSGI